MPPAIQGPAPAPTLELPGDEAPAPRILRPPDDPFPTAPASGVHARLRPLPAGLHARGAWAPRTQCAKRRSDCVHVRSFAGGAGLRARGTWALQRERVEGQAYHLYAHALAAADAQSPRAFTTAANAHHYRIFAYSYAFAGADAHAQPYHPHLHPIAAVTNVQCDNVFAFNPHAFAAQDVPAQPYHPHHHLIAGMDAQPDNGFKYSSHVVAGTGAQDAHTLAADSNAQLNIAYSYSIASASQPHYRMRRGCITLTRMEVLRWIRGDWEWLLSPVYITLISAGSGACLIC
ncbi:hypothetical protein DFH09DRAFT_1366863 [Mycena vulgaris]|nr:hypothetical protein DFH09DRAFT_1366863 [Mycena vulgaris]